MSCGQNRLRFLYGGTRAAGLEGEQQIIRTGQPIIGLPEKEVFPDGRVEWSLTTKMPLRDEEGASSAPSASARTSPH